VDLPHRSTEVCRSGSRVRGYIRNLGLHSRVVSLDPRTQQQPVGVRRGLAAQNRQVVPQQDSSPHLSAGSGSHHLLRPEVHSPVVCFR
jgi:hypothetical protein